ncbi:MAG: CDP-alcohol phosphatidyltransferase family protein [Pseudomonadota bacterium]
MGITLTAANLLTLLRLALVPFFLAAFIMGKMGWALLLFCVAAATDLIDGTVARMLGQPSTGGAILDPLADKCLVQSCFIALAVTGILPWWFVVLALIRDVIIVGGIIYFTRTSAQLPYGATVVSKFATLFQGAVAALGLIAAWKPHAASGGILVWQWLEWAMYVAAVLVVLSGIKYVSMGLAILRQHNTRHA